MSLSFIELREKVRLAGGEKEVKTFKAGSKKNVTVVVTQSGSKFSVYINDEKLDDNFKSLKDAEKSVKDFVELMGEELQWSLSLSIMTVNLLS